MAVADTKIRNTNIPPMGDRVRGLAIQGPVLQPLRERGIATLGIDERVAHSRWGDERSRTRLLFVVVSGAVGLQDQSLRAKAGQLVMIPGTANKQLQAFGRGVTAVWVHVVEQRAWQTLGGDGPSVHDYPHASLLLQLVEAMLAESVSGAPDAAASLGLLAQSLLHYVARPFRMHEPPHDQALRQQLTELWGEVAGSLDHPWTVAELSERVALSEGHFYREVRRLLGQRPMAILVRLRMERACALLQTTELTLDIIAEQLAYSSAYAFSHAFTQYLGVRPGRYRRQAFQDA